MSNFTVNDLLEEREVGTVLPLNVEVGNEIIPIFFVKDYKDTLEEINEEELVSMKNSILSDDKCFLLVMLFKFNNDFNTTYDLWLNYGYKWHSEFIEGLLNSNRIIIDFRDENNGRIKTIEVNNEIKETLKDYVKKSEEVSIFEENREETVIYLGSKKRYEIWDEEDADTLIDAIFERYDSIEELWNNI